jgi:hypothetical protein
MDKSFIIGQVTNRIKNVQVLDIGAAVQEYMELHKINGLTRGIVTVSTVGWTSATKSFTVPSNVFAVNEVYVDGELIPQTLTDEEIVGDEISVYTKCKVHPSGTIYFNFYLWDTAALVTKLTATIYDTTLTVDTLPDKHSLAALYFVLYSLYSKAEYLNEQLRKDYYNQYLTAYEKVKTVNQGIIQPYLGNDF